MTPSGFALNAIRPEQYLPVHIESGEPRDSDHRTTSEVSFHLAIYRRRPDVNAVVHSHPP